MKGAALCILIFTFSARAEDCSGLKTYWSQGGVRFYTGISSKTKNLSKAYAEAYNNAIAEAIKHNFGFYQKFNETIYQGMKSSSLSSSSSISSQNINLKGVTPHNECIENVDGEFTVFRTVSFSVKEIIAEQDRLRMIQPGATKLNKMSMLDAQGVLVLKTIPAGARFTLTSHSELKTITGISDAQVGLPVGEYQLVIEKEEFETVHRERVAVGLGSELEFVLVPRVETIVIETIPSDAQVLVNGILVEREFKVQAGQEFVIRVEHPDYFSTTQSIIVNKNSEREIHIALQPRISKLTIFSNPSEANIYVGGRHVGKSPIKAREVQPGALKVRGEKEGFESTEQLINIEPNSLETLTLDLVESKKKSFGDMLELDWFSLDERKVWSAYFDVRGIDNLPENGRASEGIGLSVERRFFSERFGLRLSAAFLNQSGGGSNPKYSSTLFSFSLPFYIANSIFLRVEFGNVNSDFDKSSSQLTIKPDLSTPFANYSLGIALLRYREIFSTVEVGHFKLFDNSQSGLSFLLSIGGDF